MRRNSGGVRLTERLSAVVSGVLTTVVLCTNGAAAQETTYDLVLTNGRVMDPESGLDAVRNVGVSNGRVAVITTAPLQGEEILDLGGLVVAPGFIDLHTHGQDHESRLFQARDGVTTALALEDGVYPVARWYASWAGKSIINYGATVGHIAVRIRLKHGLDVGHYPTNTDWLTESAELTNFATSTLGVDEISEMLALIERGLSEGGLGIGIGVEYTPGASREEVFRLFQLASRRDAPVFAHVRHGGVDEPKTGVGGMQEVIANVAATGVSLHIVHLPSMGGRDTPVILEMIDGASARGFDVTTEVYPYTAWSTFIESQLFAPGWQAYLGIDYEDLEWARTGERLSEETFEKYRREGGQVIGHGIPETAVDLAIAHPSVVIASDGMPFGLGSAHPRGAGTFARVLGVYVRERKKLTLMSALRKMTLLPAQRLESYAPQMKLKGRLQVSADADITVFDPERVLDRATFEDPEQYSQGIVHVLVAGTFVVRDEELVQGIFPGQAVRREPELSGSSVRK